MMQPGEVNRDALPAAQEALDQVGWTIEEGLDGEVEGIAAAEIGMDALAAALAGLFEFPSAKGARGPDIQEVLAYLVSMERLEDGTLAAARALVAGIKRARYEPLYEQDLEQMEAARSVLHDAIGTLLREIEEASEGG